MVKTNQIGYQKRKYPLYSQIYKPTTIISVLETKSSRLSFSSLVFIVFFLIVQGVWKYSDGLAFQFPL